MARNFMLADQALIKVDDFSQSEVDDEMDQSIFDDSDSDLMDTDIESSESIDEEGDNFESTGWTAWGASNPGFPHHPFTV